jgi:sialate O-acetylesterase
MVLQRDVAVPVWGWAGAGERVTVTFAGQTKTATADAKGKWLVKLEPMPASAEPRVMEVSGSAKIQNVLVGEVWLCSGQSNMAWTVSSSKDFETEKAAAKSPAVRMFREDSGPNPSAQEKCSGRWSVCSPDTVGGFSATAYFFGREVHQKLAVPVGLINSSVGGTPIESWTSRDVMQGKPEFAPLFERWDKAQAAWNPAKAQAQYEKQMAEWKDAEAKAKAEGKQPPRQPQKPVEPRLATHNPGNLFNGKIAPLVPYAIRGAIWYQGESNAGTPALYATQLPLMIKDWRSRWGQGDFPFAWVQLPNFRKRTDDPGAPSSWAILREGMLRTLSVPNTGMAITIDVGEENDIHPKNKQDVGKRLALWALAKVYGQKVAASGPLLAGHKVSGSEVTLSFTHTDGGLVAKGGELKGFAIAGADKKWHWANAKIVGNTLVVSSADVKEPAAVRYAWAENPDCNLYNGAGLPASPFRTDDWQ